MTSLLATIIAPIKEHFDEHGYAIARGALSPGVIDEAQRHIAWLEQRHPKRWPDDIQSTRIDMDPFWLRLVADDALLDIAQQFIGPNIALFGAAYFCKPALIGRAVLWHQDGSYWPLDPVEVVTLWLACGPATSENGCLRVIPGSHLLPLQSMQPYTEVDNVLESRIDPGLVDEHLSIDCELNPGDVEIHHPNTIHGSQANRSTYSRLGLAIRYIPASTRILDQPWQTYLLRGQAVPGVNNYWDWPAYIAGEHFEFEGCEAWASIRSPL